MKLIYLVSPFTYKAVDQTLKKSMENIRYEIVTEIGAGLIKRYHIAVIAPITMSYHFHRYLPDLGSDFKAWAEIDYRYIDACTEVWVATMEGWQISVGVQAEIAYARKKKIPVRYIDEITLNLYDNPDKMWLDKCFPRIE